MLVMNRDKIMNFCANQITKDKCNYIDEINIQLELLPSLELAELEHGIEVYGEEELNNLVENYTS